MTATLERTDLEVARNAWRRRRAATDALMAIYIKANEIAAALESDPAPDTKAVLTDLCNLIAGLAFEASDWHCEDLVAIEQAVRS